MDREDLIDMAVDAGARDFGNPDMWGVLQISYESIERFAKEVAAQERRKCEDEAITKNIVANWQCPDCERNRYRAALWRAEAYKQAGHDVIERPWVGLTDDDIAQAMFRADAIITGPMQYRFAGEVEAALKDKNT